jgi:hypothetical protein
VKEHGFYVVTSTYSANDVWVNAWESKENHVTIGFKANVVGAGEIAPSGEFYRAESASGWTHAETEVCGFCSRPVPSDVILIRPSYLLCEGW